jgi:hypothetical protein
MSMGFMNRSKLRASRRRDAATLRGACAAVVDSIMEPLERRMMLSVTPLRPDHVVVVIESDRAANALGDTANMPYLNQLANSGLVYSNYQGVNTSAQGGEMNYMALYSGSTQGITDNGRGYTFAGANLAQSLNSTAGLSFAGYSESLPSDGSQVQQAGDAVHADLYVRSHNPMEMFTVAGGTKTNADINETFNSFSSISATGTYGNLPSVSFVVPNNLDNTNGSNEAAPYATDTTAYAGLRQSADAWLSNNLNGYVQWAKTHNSILIVVGDSGDRQHNFAAGTEAIIAGDPRLVIPGKDTNTFNHFNTLRTIEDMFGLAALGSTATAAGLDVNASGQLAPPGSAITATATTTTLTTSSAAAVAGQPITLTATVSGSAASGPTGSVTFLDGSIVIATAPLSASGTASITLGLTVGNRSISAAYGGDTSNLTSTSSAAGIAVSQGATTSTLTVAPSPSVYGQAAVLTATVSVTSPATGVATGMVTFLDGATVIGTSPLQSNGSASLSIAVLATGGHSLSASYGGSTNFLSSSSTAVSHSVTAAATSTTITSSNNPAAVGQSISFTARINAIAPGSGLPTGNVQFLIDNTAFGSPVVLVNGVATLAGVSTLAGGPHMVAAVYNGDANFAASNGSLTQNTTALNSLVRPDHIVVVILEDRAANALGDPNLPYINQLANGGLLYTSFQSLNSSSQLGEMNYLGLYSGSTQGVTDDGLGYSFSGPNLGKSFNSTPGLSLAGYTESLPSDGSQVQQAAQAGGFNIPDLYTRDYNPFAMFTDAGTGKVNADVNKTFNSFSALATAPNTYANLSTVSFVIPNNLDNTHGSNDANPYGTDPGQYDYLRHTADNWLQQNLDGYVQWAKTHNSLLILTGDEGDRAHTFANGVTTIITGDSRLVVPGRDTNTFNHYSTLRTIEDMYGIAPLGNSAAVPHFDTNAMGQLAPQNASTGTIGTSVGVTANINPAASGQAITFTATVGKLSSSTSSPTGTVTFKDGAVTIGTGSLNVSGMATLVTSALAAGTHNITASYGGDANFTGNTSGNWVETVNAPTGLVNDNFANRITLSGSSITTTGTNVNATKETGEPKHAGNIGGKSVWWTWTAPASGTVTIDTTGSSFDTLLATYTGTSVSGLIAVTNGSNDDNPAGGTTTSLVKFPVTAGTVYQIAVDGYNAASGNISLHINLAMAAPVAPAGVSATQGTLTDRVRITWNAAQGAAGYEVWRSTSNKSGTATRITTSDVVGTVFDDLTAAAGTTYYYWVKAKNAGGTSAFSLVTAGHR